MCRIDINGQNAKLIHHYWFFHHYWWAKIRENPDIAKSGWICGHFWGSIVTLDWTLYIISNPPRNLPPPPPGNDRIFTDFDIATPPIPSSSKSSEWWKSLKPHHFQVENGVAKGGQHHSNISNCGELTKEVAAECRATSTPCLEMSQPSHHHHHEMCVWFISESFQAGQDGGSVGQGSCNSSDIIFQC